MTVMTRIRYMINDNQSVQKFINFLSTKHNTVFSNDNNDE